MNGLQVDKHAVETVSGHFIGSNLLIDDIGIGKYGTIGSKNCGNNDGENKNRYHNFQQGEAGGWMLDTGYWMLDTGCWLLDAGYWMLDTFCWMLDTGCWLLYAGYWMLDTFCWMLDTGCLFHDQKIQSLRFGPN